MYPIGKFDRFATVSPNPPIPKDFRHRSSNRDRRYQSQAHDWHDGWENGDGFMSKNHFGLDMYGKTFRGRRSVLAVGLLTIALTCTTQVISAEPSTLFQSDFKSALREAEEKKLPLLLHFYADWCIPCQRMEREVFTNAAVRDQLGGHFVAVKVDSDHNQDLVRNYGVEKLPSDVIVDSFTGRVIALHSGPQDRSGYSAFASQAEARFYKIHANELAMQKQGRTGGAEKPVSAVKTVEPDLGDPKPVIGLDGFSPVALYKFRKWTRGSSEFACDYKDVTYYCASSDELVEFRKNPEAIAPKLLGCDPVILWESDKAVAGNIRFGAYFENELFLFKTEERRAQFKANPEKYIRLQHALKADQIEHTVIR